MSATVLSFFRPAPTTAGDWSQQELAEFYRVEAAALQSGLRLSLERGLSDEGDPWLVFCREDGDVFLHFARIDGSYVICSDMVDGPLIGPDFRKLLTELVQRNPSVLPLPRPGSNGDAGRRGAQILMHPAALLAAIVATACLFSTMNEAVADELDLGPAHGPTTAPPHADASTVASGSAMPLASGHDTLVDRDRSRDGHDREFALLTGVILSCISAFGDAHSETPVSAMSQVLADAGADRPTSAVARTATAELEPLAATHGANVANSDAVHAPAFQMAEASATQPLQVPLRDMHELSVSVPSSLGATSLTLNGEGAPLTIRASDWTSLNFPQISFTTSIALAHNSAVHTSEAASGHERSGLTGDATVSANELSRSNSVEKAPEPQHAVVMGGVASQDGTTTRAVAVAPNDDNHASSVPAAVSDTATTPAKVAGAADAIIATVTSDVAKKGSSGTLDGVSALSAKTVSLLLHAIVDHPTLESEQSLSKTTNPVNLVGDINTTKIGTIDSVKSSAIVTTPDLTNSVSSHSSTGSPDTTTSAAHTTMAVTKAASTQTAGESHSISDASSILTSSSSEAVDLTKSTTGTSVIPTAVKTASDTTLVTAAIPSAEDAPKAVQEKAGASSTATPDVAEMSHADALHAIAALVSATNTVSRAVSISFTMDATPLDSAQLRIIDLFLNTTPDIKFRTVDNTLEIYDPSASSDVNAHATVWDVGGGALVRVIGISDGHITG